jgi:hypothetical protein
VASAHATLRQIYELISDLVGDDEVLMCVAYKSIGRVGHRVTSRLRQSGCKAFLTVRPWSASKHRVQSEKSLG